MSAYLAFLSEWYNLPWLLAATGGALLAIVGRRRHVFSPSALAVATGVTGLTLNGAIHDLGLGAIGPKFPVVAILSLSIGLLAGWFAPRLRDRVFPPVAGVTFNQPGLEGREAVVLSARVGAGGDDVGRARYRDAEGISHIVRIKLPEDRSGESLPFGSRVRLGRFDTPDRAYLVGTSGGAGSGRTETSTSS